MSHRWVIGDIHGCISTLRHLIEDKIRPSAHDTVFLLGDLIDRGPGNRKVLDYIISLQKQQVDLRAIVGNHEAMLLGAASSEENFMLWMRNGGATTLRDFGVGIDSFTGREAADLIPSGYINFLTNLPWYIETEGFFLVHAGLNASGSDPLRDTYTMIWTRNEDYNYKFLGGRKLVHGHTPSPLQEILNRLQDPASLVYNLDGGCVYRDYHGLGNLIALNLDTREPVIVQNRE